MIIEGDILIVEGECEPFRIGGVISRNVCICHVTLKGVCNSWHFSTDETVEEPEERGDLVMVILQASSRLLCTLQITYPPEERPTALSWAASSTSHLTRVIAKDIVAAAIDRVMEELN